MSPDRGILSTGTNPRPSSASEQTPENLSPIEKVESHKDVPPNGGYGWVCTGAVLALNAHTWGINSAYAVFLAYYLQNNVYPGASDLEFAFIGGLSISQALMVSPIATSVTRLYGTRVTLSIGIFLQTLALVGASFTKEIWQLILSQGFCFGWGMGFLFIGSVAIIPQWFSTRRSLASGTAAGGSGIGAMIYALSANVMITSIGVEWTFRVLAIVSFSVNTVCMILIRDRNKEIAPSQKAFDYRLLKKVEFLFLLGWGYFSLLGYIILLFSLPSFGRALGLTSMQAAILAALFNLGQAVGRSVLGLISDRLGRIDTSMYATALAAVFIFTIWMPANGYGVSIFFSLIAGIVAGVFWGTVPPVTAQVVGLKELPSALSVQWLMLVLPTTVAEPIALQLRTSGPNPYRHVQIFAGCMYIGATLCLWMLRAWKVGQLQLKIALGDADRIHQSTEEKRSSMQRTSFFSRLFSGIKV